MARILMLLLRLYQLTLSRLLVAMFGPVCRFTPSCSAYAIECIRAHGSVRGSLLSIKRLGKCHPFHPGGYDPPPPPRHGAPTVSGCDGSLAAPAASASRSVTPPPDRRPEARESSLDSSL